MELAEKSLIFPLDGRITKSCHASTICTAQNGDILAAWFGGEYEKANDVEIYLSRRSRTSGTWSTPVMVSQKDDIPCWNPVLFRQGGKITLCYKKGATIPTWKTLAIYSYDDGFTWTSPTELVHGDESGGRGPVKDKPLITSDGIILAGASHETDSANSEWRAFIDVSHDGGVTWIRGEYLNDGIETKLIQPTLWEDVKGYHALMRSKNGVIYRSDADKADLKFCEAYPTDIPNNNSGIDLVKSPDGRLFLVCNPVNTTARSPISLLVSNDGGEHFTLAVELMREDGGELSYPAVIYSDGELLITFTYNRKSVMFVCVKI